jgi:ribosomal protein L37AE/L43A
MYTKEEIRIYNQTRDVKNNTIQCVACRKMIPMTIEHRIGFGIYQCSECEQKESVFLRKIKR